jgi:diguanylate cyclase (GGDEF)-like protein
VLLLLPIVVTIAGAVAAGMAISDVRRNAAHEGEAASVARVYSAEWRLVGVILGGGGIPKDASSAIRLPPNTFDYNAHLQKVLKSEVVQTRRMKELVGGTPDGDRMLAALDAARWRALQLARGVTVESLKDVVVRATDAADAMDAFAIAADARQNAAERRAQRVTLLVLIVATLTVVVGWWLSLALFGRLQRRHVEALRELAVRDALTGLGNRRALEAAAADIGGERVVVAVCDLDGFKGYNDTFGHPAGDALLRRLATRLAASADDMDASAYRLGGDEFCVLAPDGDREAIARVCRDALAEIGDGYRVTTCVGVAVVPVDGDTVDHAMRVADSRLYVAKRARNLDGPDLSRRGNREDLAAS